MATIVVVAGNARSLIANRGHLIRAWVAEGHRVVALVPEYDASSKLDTLGIEYHLIPLVRTGMNPYRDAEGFRSIVEKLRALRPDVVFSYTIKAVVYGSIAAAWVGVPRIYSLITGMGYLYSGESGKQRALRSLAQVLYRYALARNDRVFFQNPDDQRSFLERGLLPEEVDSVIVSGSGVDIDAFVGEVRGEPPLTFLLIARLLNDKGILEFVEAARWLKRRFPETRFRIVGPHDTSLPHSLPASLPETWEKEGVVEYLGPTADVRPAIADCDVFVLPSYREGTPRSVLEAMAMGRPIVTTDAPGCRETVKEGVNGFLVPVKDASALRVAMQRFIDQPDLVRGMGAKSRAIAVEKYDVHQVNRSILRHMDLSARFSWGSRGRRLGLTSLIEPTCAAAMLAVLSPLLIVTSAAIRLDSPGSVLFKQERVGRGKKPFSVYKFRTMTHRDPARIDQNAEAVLSSATDARVTRLGKYLRQFSVDELPQLLNIARGEMSFVGPRPILPEQMEVVPPEYEDRFAVRPGLTGLAQVMGRRSLSWEQQLQYDSAYAREKSLMKDAKILVKTLRVVVGQEGVYGTPGDNWRAYRDRMRRASSEVSGNA